MDGVKIGAKTRGQVRPEPQQRPIVLGAIDAADGRAHAGVRERERQARRYHYDGTRGRAHKVV
jgi:hypothetical protein